MLFGSGYSSNLVELWTFAYDGDGTRVSTAHFTGLNPTPDSISAYYMGGAYEVTDGAARKYYVFAGQTIAMRDGTGLKYFLSDHLGSVSVVLNANGGILEQQRYLPFGGVRTDLPSPDYRITNTDFGYTSQRKLAEGMGGLMDYKARFYSPYLNQFTQPDTIVPDPYNPQAWDRYAYALNNPIRYTDPSGHTVACGTDDGNGCAGTGLGGLTPGQIIKTDANEDLKDRAIYNYSVTHPDYNYATDPEIEDVGKFIVSNAIFIGNADYVSRKPSFWDRLDSLSESLAHGGGLAIAAILAGGNYKSPDDGFSGGVGAEGGTKIIQYGDHTINESTLKNFGVTRGEFHSALQKLKKEYNLPNSFHGNIAANGNYIDPRTGTIIANIKDYLP